MQRFFWQVAPDGVTHYTDFGDMRAEYKPLRTDLYEWRITWEGLTLVQGHVPSAREAMAFVANWFSARQGSVVGEALTVLMDEAKRLRGGIRDLEAKLKESENEQSYWLDLLGRARDGNECV